MTSISGPGAGSNPMEAFGPPYPPTTAALGGVPSILPDVPITAVFLLLFILGAVAHVAIFKLNKAQAHMFFLSMVMFGFCMCRIVTCSLRIAWATHQTNVRLGIAAQIFVAVGTVLLFIINLIFAQRIIRAQHPNWGWHRAFNIAFRVLIGCTILTLIMMIVVSIQAFYTINSNTHRIDRDVQLYGSAFFTFIAFLPIPLVIVGIIIPKRVRVEKFGIGRFRHKIVFLLAAAAVLTLGAGWRAGTLYLHPRPQHESPWYFSKACFYIFDFTTEVIVVALYAIVRVDRRFHVPNGAKGPGDYARKREKDTQNLLPAHPGDFEKHEYKGAGYEDFHFDTPYASTLRIYSEEELFDDTATLAETLKYSSTSLELDNISGRWLLKRQSQASLASDPFRDSMSRGTVKTADSNIYSVLDEPLPDSKAAVAAFNPDDVRWETISMAHTHAPSYRSRGGNDDGGNDGGSHASLLGADEKPHHYSREVGLERPQRAKRDTWASLASEKARPQSYQSLTSDATTRGPPRTPKGEKRPAREKSGIDAYAYGPSPPSSPPPPSTAGDLAEKKSYRYDAPETGDLSDKRSHGRRESLEVPPSRGRHSRKSSWRKSVESELRLSMDQLAEERELADAYEALTNEKQDAKGDEKRHEKSDWKADEKRDEKWDEKREKS